LCNRSHCFKDIRFSIPCIKTMSCLLLEYVRSRSCKCHECRGSNVDKCSRCFVAFISYRVSHSNLHNVTDESSFNMPCPYQSITPYHARYAIRLPPRTRATVLASPSSLLPPITKPSRHEIGALLQIWPMIALIEQTLYIVVLRHLPPFVPLFLFSHNFLCE
jgi:hypothetical protein